MTNNLITKKAVKEYAKECGVSVRYHYEYQEWDVEGYLTDDNGDAMAQIAHIANVRNNALPRIDLTDILGQVLPSSQYRR